MAINACDYIVLPYRYSFDGASGPLVDGVIADKIIIGANHGSLGNLINNNNLLEINSCVNGSTGSIIKAIKNYLDKMNDECITSSRKDFSKLLVTELQESAVIIM